MRKIHRKARIIPPLECVLLPFEIVTKKKTGSHLDELAVAVKEPPVLPVALELHHNAVPVLAVLNRFKRVPASVPRREAAAYLLAQAPHPGSVRDVERSQVQRVLLRGVEGNFSLAMLALLVRFRFRNVAVRALFYALYIDIELAQVILHTCNKKGTQSA